jgi:oligopeptide/dipeptide ABC transporter ATP-binding protein
MYLGRIVEKGPVEAIFKNPRHPYTRALVAAVPIPDPRVHHEVVPLEGETPSPVSPPSGCAFHPRCPFVVDECRVDTPTLQDAGESSGDSGREHRVACIRKDQI